MCGWLKYLRASCIKPEVEKHRTMMVSLETEVVCSHMSVHRVFRTHNDQTVRYWKDVRKLRNRAGSWLHASGDSIYPSLRYPKIARSHLVVSSSVNPPLDLRVHEYTKRSSPATGALEIPGMECAGINVPRRSRYAAL